MVCKCGAMVKASGRRARNCPFQRRYLSEFRGPRHHGNGLQADPAAAGPQANVRPFRLGDDRGQLVQEVTTDRRRYLGVAGALEQHPPLEGARAHDTG